jgi:WD40 repeat protein
LLATASWDGTVRLWDAALGGNELARLCAQNEWALCCAFSPDAGSLACTALDRSVSAWKLSGALVREPLFSSQMQIPEEFDDRLNWRKQYGEMSGRDNRWTALALTTQCGREPPALSQPHAIGA